jgi:hypothetical protein
VRLGARRWSGQQAAGSGAVATMAGEPKLAGAPRLLLSEHRFLKGKYREGEKLTANVARGLARAEREREARVATGK